MFQVQDQHPHTTEVLTLTEEFDCRITPGLQVLILSAQQSGRSHLILDFSNVTDIDSNSFRRFFCWYRNIMSDQLQISLVKPRAPIWTQFHSWHASDFVQGYASLQEATWNSAGYS